jgi:hypothetical protein
MIVRASRKQTADPSLRFGMTKYVYFIFWKRIAVTRSRMTPLFILWVRPAAVAQHDFGGLDNPV